VHRAGAVRRGLRSPIEQGPYAGLVVYAVQLGDELHEPSFGLSAEPGFELVAERRQPRAHERDDRAAKPFPV